jgi:predicted phosphodiesterase
LDHIYDKWYKTVFPANGFLLIRIREEGPQSFTGTGDHMEKRYAVMADIHGNVWALQAVLEDAAERNATDYINLGDSLYGPLKPNDTYALLREKNIISIAGNQDRLIISASSQQIAENPTLQYVLEDLDDEAIDWLNHLPSSMVLDKTLFLCHGAPGSDTTYLLEDVSSGIPRIRDNHAISQLLEGQDFPVFLCGHSHLPHTVQLAFGKIVINPGSVGLPAFSDDAPVLHRMETGSPHADYALLEKKNNVWQVIHVKVPYTHYEATRQAGSLGREDWGYALLNGRAKG